METRQMLLKIKPGNRTNWISFAIAHHLNGSHELAVQMLDTFETNIMGVCPVAVPATIISSPGRCYLKCCLLAETGRFDTRNLLHSRLIEPGTSCNCPRRRRRRRTTMRRARC